MNAKVGPPRPVGGEQRGVVRPGAWIRLYGTFDLAGTSSLDRRVSACRVGRMSEVSDDASGHTFGQARDDEEDLARG